MSRATGKAAASRFVCSACGAATAKWAGQCPHCQAWNTLSEAVNLGASSGRATLGLAPVADVTPLHAVQVENLQRTPTGIDEFDRVLGGGLVDGAVVLIGGDPGIGKSTLLLQALASLARELPVLYVSGEESVGQIALRAQRLGVPANELPELRIAAEIDLDRIISTAEKERPQVLVVDSIQTVYWSQIGSAPGSVAQVRECAAALTRFAKQTGTVLILVGHVTKEGALAGPRVLEHMVDTVLYFEGDTHSSYRLVRAMKNRFGAVNELGVFAMTDRGLRGVANPSALFLSQRGQDKGGALVPGSCVLATQEGTRPLLVEIQALVDTAHVPNPRRLCVGLDPQRLAMLLAVLSRHAGVATFDQDVFLNAVGGVRIDEPAADLAVLMAVHSSLRNRALDRGLVVFGEVGLAGEVRPAPRGQERLREAAKLGFSRAIIPRANAPRQAIEGLTVVPVDRVDEALAHWRADTE
jgi:DNA repair protein RadA/Sms